MTASRGGIGLWSATLADPAEEAGFRAEHAGSLRRNGLIAVATDLAAVMVDLMVDPLPFLQNPAGWPSDLTRMANLMIGLLALVQLWRRRDLAGHGVWLPALWLSMLANSTMASFLDPLIRFDGGGGMLTLALMGGFAGFSAVCAVDFRWSIATVAGTASLHALSTFSGQVETPVRDLFIVITLAAAAVFLAIAHSVRRNAREQYLALERERRLVAQLDAARAAAERANAVKTQFVATMSHEFRTPLNAILGMAELLAETRLDGRQRRFVDILAKAVDHLSCLVGDILDFSRIESDRMVLAAEPFDPGDNIHEIIDLMSSEAQAKGLALEAVLAPGPSRRRIGDPLRLRQVLLNLVGNALRHCQQGGVVVRLEPVAGSVDTLLLAVEDTGPGVPPAERDTIFEPYIQGSGRAGGGGLGLGLAISRRLVAAMGGRLWLEDRPGGGSRFCFTLALPVAEPVAAPAPSEPAAGLLRSSLAAPAPTALRLLVADDSGTNRMVVSEYLRALPVEVEQARDGAEALARFKTGVCAAVLIDVQMPRLDGLAAVRAMREWERERGRSPVPIFAVTAGTQWEDQERAMAAGCTGFLAKPVKRRVLLQVLAEHLPDLARQAECLAPEAPEAGDGSGRFREEIHKALQRLRQAADADENGALAREAHAQRGLALTLGLGSLAGRLARLETAEACDRDRLLGEAQAALEVLAEAPAEVWALPPAPEPPALAPAELAPDRPLRILLCEDHTLVREGLRTLLEAEPEFRVVGETGDGLACIQEACRLNPGLVIIDLMMPRMAGRDAIAEIRRRRAEIRILVLTAVSAPEPILEALRAGADGVVHKGAMRAELKAAIAAICTGTLYLSPGLPVATEALSGAPLASLALSIRERQVLKLLVEGKRNREIGDLLHLSPRTVEKHRASLMKKLEVDTAAELANHALRYGLIETTVPSGLPTPEAARGE